MPARLAELVRTAPDWATADVRSAEVTAWLDRAHRIADQLRPAEAGCLRVHIQFVHNDVARHGPEIVKILRRIAGMRKNRTRQSA
jgi:hypothetical protein